jgi:two-component system nitrate/nitrite response regulator NarL
MRQVSIVVADDHPLYRDGLVRLVRERPEFKLAAECRDGDEALAAIEAHAPDVALLDLHLPRRDAIDVLRELRVRGHTGTRVVMISVSDDGATVHESIAAGAAGYLVKEAGAAEICDALSAVASGRTVLPASLHAGLAAEIQDQAEAHESLLSPREEEVLRWTAEGRSVREVAAQLVVSTATVKTHLQHIYAKLDVSDRAAAVAKAMRRGLLD